MATLRARGGRSVTTRSPITTSPRVGIFYAGNHAHQGTLAAAGRAEKNEKLALAGLEIDTVDCTHLAE